MAEYKDIITDENGNVIIENGDLKVGLSDSQHVEHILVGDRGQFRQFPLIGVGLIKQLNGPRGTQALKQQIKLQLEADGYNVRQIKFDPSNPINIDLDVERKNT